VVLRLHVVCPSVVCLVKKVEGMIVSNPPTKIDVSIIIVYVFGAAKNPLPIKIVAVSVLT